MWLKEWIEAILISCVRDEQEGRFGRKAALLSAKKQTVALESE